MLQTMRNNAQGMIAKTIVGFIIIVFVLFGVESIVTIGGGEKPVAVVGDMEIFEVDVLRTVSVQKQELQRQFGDQFDESLFNDEFLRTSAIERLINQRVAITQADELGLFAPSQQIDQTILSTPAFQRDGQFDAEQYKYVLRVNALSPTDFREQMAADLKVQQAQALFILSSFDTDFASQFDQALENEGRQFRYIEFNNSDFSEQVKVTDEQIEAEYQQVKSTLLNPEQLAIKYVELKRSDLAADVELAEEDIIQAYEQYIAEQNASEVRQARHILLEVSDERDVDSSLEIAKQAKQRLVAGESFQALVAELSDDIGTKSDGGNLGFNERGTFEASLDDAIYTLKPGEVSEPVVTEFGVHLVELTDVRKSDVQSLETIRDQLSETLMNDMIEAKFAELQQELSNTAFSSGSVEEVAEVFSLSVQTSELFSLASGEGIANDREIRQLAFADNMKLDRELSSAIETADGVVVFGVSDIQEAAVKPLAEVSDQIRRDLVRKQSAVLAKQKAETALEDNVGLVWTEVDMSASSAGETPRAVKKQAFSMSNSEMDIVEITNGFALVHVLDIDRQQWQSADVDTNQRERSRTESSRGYVASYQTWSKSSTAITQN